MYNILLIICKDVYGFCLWSDLAAITHLIYDELSFLCNRAFLEIIEKSKLTYRLFSYVIIFNEY